jgi:small subunit ribosomal protein S27Ae
MAKETKDAKGDKKGKAASKGKWQYYDTKGELKRQKKSCPKCGPGVFLGQHQDRLSCGKCGYTEYTREKIIHVFPSHHKAVKPKEEKPKEEKPSEAEAPKEEAKKGGKK